LTGSIAVNISEGNVTGFATEVLEILPASISGDTRNQDPDTRGPASTNRSPMSVFVRFTTRPRFLGEFYNDVLAHEVLAVEVP
jgi:hypothetical protein